MNKYTIGQLKKGLPSREYAKGMFYDWFVADRYLGGRGEKCLARLRALVEKRPDKFRDTDEIDFKNCLPGNSSRTYDCVRVWRGGVFKYAFVPKEADGTASMLEGKDGEIAFFSNWRELKAAFCSNN